MSNVEFAPQAQAPRPRRRAGVLVLSILMVLGLAGAATFGALYFTEKQERERVAAELTTQLAAKEKVAADATKQAQDAKSQAQDATTKMQQAQGAKDEAEAKAGGYAKCHDVSRALIDAAIAQDDSKAREVMQGILRNCR